jgi:hypothetical protein
MKFDSEKGSFTDVFGDLASPRYRVYICEGQHYPEFYLQYDRQNNALKFFSLCPIPECHKQGSVQVKSVGGKRGKRYPKHYFRHFDGSWHYLGQITSWETPGKHV